MYQGSLPPRQGLYDPRNEHDNCGVGFVADIHGRKSHRIIEQGLEILRNLTHRGAVGADKLAGDGAGILMQTPDEFLRAVCAENGLTLPAAGAYAVAMIFLPQDENTAAACVDIIENFVNSEGQIALGWRDVPVDNSGLGYSVLPSEPVTRQLFIGRGDNCTDQDAFERKLFIIRKQVENQVRDAGLPDSNAFYITSMSSRTLLYKGILLQ